MFTRSFVACAAIFVAFRAAPETLGSVPTTAGFGTWKSPITIQSLADDSIHISDLRVAGDKLYWSERRAADGGRAVIVQKVRALTRTLTPAGYNVRTRVHEYGGAAYVVTPTGVIFSNLADQRLYEQGENGTPTALTPEGFRYADCVQQPAHSTLICVREDHTPTGGESSVARIKNSIVAIDRERPGAGTVLFADTDFVAFPRVSKDGKRLAWIAWNFPNMPWDTTMLYVADLTDTGLKNSRVVAGGKDESVVEPQWAADGALYFLSDRDDLWNLYVHRGSDTRRAGPRLGEMARPLWWLGQSNYVLSAKGEAVVRYAIDMVDHLAVVNLKRGTFRELDLPFVRFDSLLLRGPNKVVAIASSTDREPVIVSINTGSGAFEIIQQSTPIRLETGLVSRAQPVTFASEGGRTAYALYYAPHNPAFAAPGGQLPPLIIDVHGGPTFAASTEYNPRVQFWTSRGFAIADVNYGGSSGYGRAYRQLLKGKWGITDVQDVEAAAKFFVAQGKADPQRLILRGSSAGGYTVLSALWQTSHFAAAVDYFGVADIGAISKQTHKFESHYLDTLVAPYPAGRAVIEERSPLQHLSGFNTPLLVMQGSEDPVVPPAQAHVIVEALRAHHVPVAYIEFPGEGHGFVKAETITRAAEAELYFLGRVLGFAPADQLPTVQIDNAAALKMLTQ